MNRTFSLRSYFALAVLGAITVLLSGIATTRPAEAAPTAVSVSVGSAGCALNIPITATVTDGLGPQTGTLVTFTTNIGTTTASSATTVGVASATLVIPSGTVGSVTVTATAAPASGNATFAVNCVAPAYDPCASYTLCTCYGFYTLNSCGNLGCNSYINSVACGACTVNDLGCEAACGNIYSANCGGTSCGMPYGAGLYYYGFSYICTANSLCGITAVCDACNVTYTSGCWNGGKCVGSTSAYNACLQASCSNENGTLANCTSAYVPPATTSSRLTIIAPTSGTCGSSSAITVTVVDANGNKVPDGTQVLFNTTLGLISTSNDTEGGTAVSSLTIPSGTRGSARITATSGSQSATATINVTCG